MHIPLKRKKWEKVETKNATGEYYSTEAIEVDTFMDYFFRIWH